MRGRGEAGFLSCNVLPFPRCWYAAGTCPAPQAASPSKGLPSGPVACPGTRAAACWQAQGRGARGAALHTPAVGRRMAWGRGARPSVGGVARPGAVLLVRWGWGRWGEAGLVLQEGPQHQCAGTRGATVRTLRRLVIQMFYLY